MNCSDQFSISSCFYMDVIFLYLSPFYKPNHNIDFNHLCSLNCSLQVSDYFSFLLFYYQFKATVYIIVLNFLFYTGHMIFFCL